MAIQVEDVNDASEITNVKGEGGAMHVKNVAVEPGQDATFNRAWGGALCTPVRRERHGLIAVSLTRAAQCGPLRGWILHGL